MVRVCYRGYPLRDILINLPRLAVKGIYVIQSKLGPSYRERQRKFPSVVIPRHVVNSIVQTFVYQYHYTPLSWPAPSAPTISAFYESPPRSDGFPVVMLDQFVTF